MKRLAAPTGQIDVKKHEGDSPSEVVRDAILVHSGPEGEKITFLSSDGEIDFDDARIQEIVKSQNTLVDSLAKDYGTFDKIPIGAFPPILDMHAASDSIDRVVGRLNSSLRYEKRDVPKVGKNVSCVLAKLTFLGEDSVKKVNDGRIYHLSVGIDEATNTLGELSVVIEPAAPGAMLLNKGHPKKGINTMSKKHLEASKKKLTTLSSMKSELTTLKGKVNEANDLMKLTKRKGEITHRLSSLMSGKKLTPAEYKKMDLVKLASMPEDVLKMTLDVFEAREPQVLSGQHGSVDAREVSSIASNLKKTDLARLTRETKKDIKKLTGGKAFKDENLEDDKDEKDLGAGGNDVEKPTIGKDPSAVPGEEKIELAKKIHMCHMEMGKHLEAGNIEEAKKVHAEMSKHLEVMKPEGMEKHLELGMPGDVKSEDYKASMDMLQKQIDELNTQMGRVAGMVDELIKVEQDEGDIFEQEAKEHANLDGEGKPANPVNPNLKDEIKGDLDKKDAQPKA